MLRLINPLEMLTVKPAIKVETVKIQILTPYSEWRTLTVCENDPDSILAAARGLTMEGYTFNRLWIKNSSVRVWIKEYI